MCDSHVNKVGKWKYNIAYLPNSLCSNQYNILYALIDTIGSLYRVITYMHYKKYAINSNIITKSRKTIFKKKFKK